MSKAKGAGSAFGKVLTYILVVLLLLGIVGGVAYFFMRNQGMTFYVEYDGNRYLANGESKSVELSNDSSPFFTVKSFTGEEVNYSVKVTSNGANNFSFTVGDELWYLWNDDDARDDYTEVFGLEKNTDGFSLSLPDGFTLEQAIEAKYGAEIVLQEGSDIQEDLNYFLIVVTVDDGIVRIPFRFSNLTLTLDTTHIIFGGDSAGSENPPSEMLPEQEETFIRYMVQAAQAQSYEEVQPTLGTSHRMYTDFVMEGSTGNSDLRTAMSAYVALFRAVEDREYTADEAASVREDLGDLMERYEPME